MTKKPSLAIAKIATRGSALALWQADYIGGLLKARGLDSEKLIIKTTADRIQDRFLHEIGGKGLFVKELEDALVKGEADLAVHSLKDMTATLQPPFVLAAILPRHAATDVMIFRDDVAKRVSPKAEIGAADIRGFGSLTIGTGSLRRQALLAGANTSVTCVGIRGNVDTRLRKLKEGAWDAIVLAEASLDRLNLKAGLHVSRLDPKWFIPCASQGALAVETTATHELATWLADLGSKETTAAVGIERGMLALLGGDCNMPFGCLVAKEANGDVIGRAVLLARDGREARAEYRVANGAGFDASDFLHGLSAKLRDAGAADIMRALGIEVTKAFQ